MCFYARASRLSNLSPFLFDNPYEGQIFYYPHTQDTFTYIVPKNQSGSGQWVMVTYQDFTSNRN